ncbi:hypothetical protein JD844_027056 [Phrynosoma platyrhinos]|uniref:DUF3719 domain-containing protein n=1 Tax=Phrynosoma platyrhinos TaxID=52577 RepID=A0ABQ7SFQ9_PHRPL|nr:hypothetical protein JD844_027056 [Phrynosoma platyrhinos]
MRFSSGVQHPCHLPVPFRPQQRVPKPELAIIGKGLSRRSSEHCFQGKNEDGLPAPFTKRVQEAIDNYTLILGKQLLFPKDEGFQHYQSRNPSSLYSRSLPSLSEISSMKELCISGYKLVPATFPVHKAFSSELPGIGSSEASAYSFLEEEIYDAEGKIEEYLAFDNKELGDESLEQRNSQLAQRRIKHGIPPVSPNACIKDAVVAEVFDHVWNNHDRQTEKLKATGNKLPHLLVSRVAVDTSSVPPSRGSEARSMSFGLHFVPAQYLNPLSISSSHENPLSTVLASLDTVLRNEQEDKSQRIGSSVNSARNRLGRITDNSVLSLSRVLPGSSRKIAGHHRLPSIASEPLHSKTANVYSDEILRGTKLCTTLDRLSSPLPPMMRNKLPPINTDAVDQYLSVPGIQLGFHKGRHPHSRISSAVPDGMEQRPLRERAVIIDQFSRPNTTHTFRVHSSMPDHSREIHLSLGGDFKLPHNIYQKTKELVYT